MIVLSSPPACGKTTWSINFQKQHANTFIVAVDKLRQELLGRLDKNYVKEDLWNLFDDRIREYASYDLDNLVVIADSAFALNKHRRQVVERHPEFDRYVLVLFTCLIEESIENNQSRDDDLKVLDNKFFKDWKEFEKPDIDTLEMYDEFIRVIGNYKRTKVNK